METKSKSLSKQGSILKNFAGTIDSKYEEYKKLDGDAFDRLASYLMEKIGAIGTAYTNMWRLKSDLGIYFNQKKRRESKAKNKATSKKDSGQMTFSF